MISIEVFRIPLFSTINNIYVYVAYYVVMSKDKIMMIIIRILHRTVTLDYTLDITFTSNGLLDVSVTGGAWSARQLCLSLVLIN